MIMEVKPTPWLLPRSTFKTKDNCLPASQVDALKSEFKTSSSSAFYAPKSDTKQKTEIISGWSPAPSMAISEYSNLSPLIETCSPIKNHTAANYDGYWENMSPISTNLVSPLPSPEVPEIEQTRFCTPISEQLSSDLSFHKSFDSKSDKTSYYTPVQSLSPSSSLIQVRSTSIGNVDDKLKNEDWREIASRSKSRTNMRSSPSKWFNVGMKRNRCVEIKSINRGDSENVIESLPQNLKGDPTRQAKVKTELCKFYIQGCNCPFGSRCNYAHGKNIFH